MSVHLVGDNNANTLTADADDLFIWGEGGVDTLNGNGLNNKLGGGNGSESDTLNGGNGDDILLIQRGNDTLNGGANFDIARVADMSGSILSSYRSSMLKSARLKPAPPSPSASM